MKDAIREDLGRHGMADVIDARTNQLVWRGHDVNTLNTDHPDKTLSKAVDNVLDRFYHDAKHSGTGHA